MPYISPVSSPNIEKLLNYLNKSQWHNVSTHFAGYVRKEYDHFMERLDDDEEVYRNLRLMIEYSEMGRFSEARNLLDVAYREHQHMIARLTELNQKKISPRRPPQRPVEHQHNYPRRDTYTPDRRELASPLKRSTNPREDHTHGNHGYESPKRQQEVQERHPRTPQYQQDQGQQYDIHKQNYENLRLKTPEQLMKYDPAGHNSNEDHGSRPNSHRAGRQTPPSSGVLTSAAQMTSSKALWGRDFGDKPSEKVGSSTYRQDFPTYPIDHHERKDKERYRENFGSLAERDIYRRESEDGSIQGDARRSVQPSRHIETPDHDNRPLELAKRFRELYVHEWTDAYDEICKDFGSEKTVRHLLWIVTECSLISNDVADHQLRTLEKKAFGVMTTPGDVDEAWLLSADVASKQLKDLEKTAIRLMKTPNKENLMTTPTPTSPISSSSTNDNHGGFIPRQLGDTLPASRTLLLKYRKQTAILSIPYVKEECREKIGKTLIESSGFPKSYLTDASRLTAYINKCAELTWLMCVQDPPIVLEYITKETEGARFNSDHYHVYTKPGNTYDYGVWPMLRLGKKGQIVAKGIAQGI